MTRALIAGLLLLVSHLAFAHQQGSSYSHWRLNAEGVPQSVTVKISALDLTRVGLHQGDQFNAETSRYLQQRLSLLGCSAGPALVSLIKTGWYSVSWNWRCEPDAPLVIRSNILADSAPNHLHFARWQHTGGAATDRGQDALLSRDRRAVQLRANAEQVAESQSGIGQYFMLGAEHIFVGYDHLAFLLGLLLLASGRRLIGLVTGFTVGHSLTLALASSGSLLPNIAYVEAAIAWSIALLCAEILSRRSGARWPWCLPLALLLVAVGRLPAALLLGLAIFTVGYALALSSASATASRRLTSAITVAFGLIHGCGFATILGFGTADIAIWALFGFNLGIEFGQLVILLFAWPLLLLLQRWRSEIKAPLAYGLLALASYWWVLRI